MTDKKTNFQLNQRRYFSKSFKESKVKDIQSKKITISQLSTLYDINPGLIYKWLKTYAPEVEPGVKISYEMESEAEKTLYYKERVVELERIVGQKQIELDFMNQLVNIASQELKVDIKKNFSTQPSNGSVSAKNQETSQ